MVYLGFNLLTAYVKANASGKAKKEKLSSAKNNVRNMKESVLKDKVADFLDAHPEFCDNFIE